MTRMGKANEKSLEEVSKIVLGPAFHSDGVTAKKVCIRSSAWYADYSHVKAKGLVILQTQDRSRLCVRGDGLRLVL